MKLLVSALEHSANIHLKSVAKHLGDDVEFIGIFDNSLGESIIDLRSFSIMGFVDALKKLPFFFKLNNQMVQLAQEADKILLIDSSGFNLPLAKKIKKKYPDKEIIYYILPQAWAWKKKRIVVLQQVVDTLCSILPFEPSYYPKEANISYVGHPLLDQISTFKQTLNKEVKQVLFMPGSRKGEIKKLMPIYHEIRKQLPHVEALLVIPPFFTQEEKTKLYGDTKKFTLKTDAHQAMLEADFAFICSGTATLEASLIGIPFILTYIAKPFDFFIAKNLVKIEYIGLANIMFKHMNKKPLHPEFLQEDVTASNLLREFQKYNRENFLENSKVLREYLKHGSSEVVAKIILN